MEFKKVKLGEIGKIVGGGTPKTKEESYYGGEIAWITPKDLSLNKSKYIFYGERNITEEGLKNSSAKLLPKGTVLFSSRAPIGYVAIAGNDLATNQGFKSVIPAENVDSEFIYYLLINNVENIKNFGVGSTFREVSGSVMKNIEVMIPDFSIQRKIAKILNTLDSKIEINNKIISNLESQAQAIFKSWFVDFEPFQDGDFVESELGMIPKGWEVKELGEVADFSNGYSFKSKDLLEEKKSKNDYKVFKQADIKVGGGINPNNTKSWIDSEFIRKNKLSRFIIQSGDLMMCMTDMKNNVRLLGNTALVYQPDEYILNQRVGRLRSKQKEIKPSFLYYLTNNSVFLNDLRGRANTGVQVNLSTSEIKRSKVILPTCDIIKRFCDYSESITKSINSLNNQNTKLAELRDALLPKLMAGEIDVSDIKIEGEEVKNE